MEAFIFQVEQYARLMGMCDDHGLAMFASMLLTGPAAVWLRGQNWDWQADGSDPERIPVSWEHDVKASLHQYFRPPDYERRAHD